MKYMNQMERGLFLDNVYIIGNDNKNIFIKKKGNRYNCWWMQ